MPGDVNLWPNLSGSEVIDLLGRLRGRLGQGRRADLLDRFELDPAKMGRTYPQGNRQKVALVAALARPADTTWGNAERTNCRTPAPSVTRRLGRSS